MKLAVSHIAWNKEEDEKAYGILSGYGVKYIEIAPSRFDLNPLNINIKGLQIVAMQALLFGKPEFNIFSTPEKRAEMLEYLKKVIDFGADAGAKTLVFGSPKNRLVGDMPKNKAYTIAEEFFTEIGNHSAKYGIKFCIESNPTGYGADFITSTPDAFAFYAGLNNPGIGFHLDTGAMTMINESPQEIIGNYLPHIVHVHISEPFLAQTGSGNTDHRLIAGLLKELNYQNYISIEMKSGLGANNLETLEKSIEFCQNVY